MRKVKGESGQYRLDRLIVGIDAENYFELGIIQAAETGQVFVSVRIQPPNRFQDADSAG